MTGPEHYRLAEEKLRMARQIANPESGHSDADAIVLVGLALQRAQVHATLALTAATAQNDAEVGYSIDEHREWESVVGAGTPERRSAS